MTAEIRTLANGMRVALDPMPGVETVALGVWVGAGSRHETEELNGLSHLLEHMAFKGTATRSARAIAEEIENVGGHLNAYTGRETTAYHATVLKEDVELGVDLVADILRRSAFDPEELERERGVILQEIGQAHDTPDDVVFDVWQETALPGQPLGRPVLGVEATVRAIRREDLFAAMARRYVPSNMVFSAAGRIDQERVVDLVHAAFGDLPAAVAPPGPAEPMRYAGGETRDSRDLEQAHLVLGLEAFGYRDPDHYALAVFSTLFGGGMSSRLFQTIREDRGLVYSVHSFASSYADGGLFGVYAGTDEEDIAELVPLVCEEFAKVGDSMSEGEIARARAQLKAGTLMALESSSSRCEQAARQTMIHGRLVPYEEIVARIEAVDETALRRVVRRLLASPPTLAAMGPIGPLESVERIARRLAV